MDPKPLSNHDFLTSAAWGVVIALMVFIGVQLATHNALGRPNGASSTTVATPSASTRTPENAPPASSNYSIVQTTKQLKEKL